MVGTAAMTWHRTPPQGPYVTSAVFEGQDDVEHPYGRWSLILQPLDNGLYRAEWLVSDASSQPRATLGARFRLYEGATCVAEGQWV